MSALFISRVTVKDPTKFQSYLQKSKEIAAQYGAELLASGEAPRALSGTATPHQLAVVVRFPTMADADAWQASQEYQDIVQLREESSDQEITIYQMGD